MIKAEETCPKCAGWGDHPMVYQIGEGCDCEYSPEAVLAGGQCPWCDVGMKCNASAEGYTCPYAEFEKSQHRVAFSNAWLLLKEDKAGMKKKLIQCLKSKGGAASLEECCKACDASKEECRALIRSMDNVKISPHGDVILMDGLR